MLRLTLTRSLRSLAVPASRSLAAPVRRPLTSQLTSVTRPSLNLSAPLFGRFYSAAAGLNKEEIQGRILDLLKSFDKVTDASKLNSEVHFAKDLGLDSLDTVEVVMAIEEEFSIEIPDKEADAIHSVPQAVEYISKQPDAQ